MSARRRNNPADHLDPQDEFADDPEAPDEYDQDQDPDDETDPCPKCGKPIHYESEWCPHCGSYLSREDDAKRLPTWAVILLIVAGITIVFIGVLSR